MLGAEFLPCRLSISVKVRPEGRIPVSGTEVPRIIRACCFIAIAIGIVDVGIPKAVRNDNLQA